jgi:hypothetical protein
MTPWASEIPVQLTVLAELFALIYVLNVIPAFAPPTWLTVAFIGLTIPEIEAWRLVPVAASAATLGRLSLAKLSRRIVRQNFLSEAVRQNIDAIKHGLEKRVKLTFGLFLLYAFGPLPSNYLFIAYGLTTLRLTAIAAPFFIGRSCSYGVTLTTASAVAKHRPEIAEARGLSGAPRGEIVARHRNGEVGAQAEFLARRVGRQVKALADVLAGEVEERLGRLQDAGVGLDVAALCKRQQQRVRPGGGSGSTSDGSSRGHFTSKYPEKPGSGVGLGLIGAGLTTAEPRFRQGLAKWLNDWKR